MNGLRKRIMFNMVQRLNEDLCFQCGERIETVDELSIEHKIPWKDDPERLYDDLSNIAWSHLSCNRKAARWTQERRKAASERMKGNQLWRQWKRG